eukprot:TRINITY_DN75821_c0_g1_i1.p1 TRINITY_DN75821_c0_g1~~TRINITY_DN75821_c0_g1_i1.p1  ORF type:complete len:1571 (+),score=329.99 TRINITY_DN75821_c0_g1_i1:66-4715(+)
MDAAGVKTEGYSKSNPSVDDLREDYKKYAQEEHGCVINPITGDEVDIMQQCVNLELDMGEHHEVGDTDAYREVIADFAEHLPQCTMAWVALENGQYERGHIHRVNDEDDQNVTYDFQYSKSVSEDGKKKDKTFVIKDVTRGQVKTRPLLVKGDPAGGKTTFAKQLLTWVLRHAESTWLVPVLVRTVDLVRSWEAFEEDGHDMVDQYLAIRYSESGHYNLFRQAREQGRLLVILDGFDEAGPLERKLVTQISEKLVNEVFLVLTSRDMGATFKDSAFSRFRSVRVKELNEKQQRQVISSRLQCSQLVERFCTQLTLNPALSLMAKNPLLLNVTLAVFESCNLEEGTCLNRGKVYSLALDGMLGSIDKTKALHIPEDQIGTLASSSAVRTVLRQIAYLAHTAQGGHGIRDFRRELIERAIKTSGLAPAEFTLEHWLRVEEVVKKGRLPVLTWFAESGEDTFRFSHLTFQEFLCAEQCLLKSQERSSFIPELRELVCPNATRQLIDRGWWQQTIQMYCDLASDVAKTPSGKSLGVALGENFLRLDDDEDSMEEEGEENHTRECRFAGINDNNVLTLMSMLQTSNAVQGLTLHGTITCQGISTIRSLRTPSLKRLNLRHNCIGPEGCLSIAHFIEVSDAPLEYLDLGDNIICQGEAKPDKPPESRRNPRMGYYDSHFPDLRGLKALLAALRQHRSLQKLELRGNFLPIAAGRLMAEALLGNSHLQEVCGVKLQSLRDGVVKELPFECEDHFIGRHRDESGLFLSTGGAEFLLEALLKFPQPELEELKLANQALPSDSAGVVELFDKLGGIVASSKKIRKLNLRGYWDCGAEAGRALGAHIREHETLEELLLGTGEALDLSRLRQGSAQLLELGKTRMRDFGAGILSKCLPAEITKVSLTGAGLGASGYKALAKCPQLDALDGIELGAFTESCSELDLSAVSGLRNSAGAVAFVIERTALTPNLVSLNLSEANLTSKSHPHVLTPVIGGSWGIGCNGGCDHRSFAGSNAYANCEQCDLDFCSTCLMSGCPMIALAEALERLPCLQTLKISNCAFQGGRLGPVRSHLDEEGYRVLGAALERHTKLTELDISRNHFKGPGFPHLLRGVAEMPALSSLQLESHGAIDCERWHSAESITPDTDLSAAELHFLALSLSRNHSLRSLDLSQVNHRFFNLNTSRALAQSIVSRGERAVTVEEICLPDADGSIRIPLRDLHEGRVSELILNTQDRIDRSSLAPMFELALNLGRESLTNVDLSSNDFGIQTEMVVDALLPLSGAKLRYCNGIDLELSRNLEDVRLEGMPIMPHGACVLASTVLKAGSIVQLDLSSSGLDATSLGAVLRAMLQRPTTTWLNVSNNRLAGEGVRHLAEFLRLDKKLQTLLARNISTPARGDPMLEFSNALEANISLVRLDLCKNLLQSEVVGRLRRTLEERRSVVPMSLDAKICLLLCNRRLPRHLQLPEMIRVADVSRLFASGAYSPLFLIFQFCGQARQLLLDEVVESQHEGDDHMFATFATHWPGLRPPDHLMDESDSDMESDEDSGLWQQEGDESSDGVWD